MDFERIRGLGIDISFDFTINIVEYTKPTFKNSSNLNKFISSVDPGDVILFQVGSEKPEKGKELRFEVTNVTKNKQYSGPIRYIDDILCYIKQCDNL